MWTDFHWFHGQWRRVTRSVSAVRIPKAASNRQTFASFKSAMGDVQIKVAHGGRRSDDDAFGNSRFTLRSGTLRGAEWCLARVFTMKMCPLQRTERSRGSRCVTLFEIFNLALYFVLGVFD
jgi:hypothetical protein